MYNKYSGLEKYVRLLQPRPVGRDYKFSNSTLMDIHVLGTPLGAWREG